jgi:hypothetical protein
MTKREIISKLSEKKFVISKQLDNLKKDAYHKILTKDSIIKLEGKLQLIEELASELDLGEIRRVPAQSDLII